MQNKLISPEATSSKPLGEPGTEVMTLQQAVTYLRISKAHLSNVINGKVPDVPPLRHASVGAAHPDQAHLGGRMAGRN